MSEIICMWISNPLYESKYAPSTSLIAAAAAKGGAAEGAGADVATAAAVRLRDEVDEPAAASDAAAAPPGRAGWSIRSAERRLPCWVQKPVECRSMLGS